MAEDTVVRQPKVFEADPGFGSFVAASVVAGLLTMVFAFFCIGSEAQNDFVLDSKINPNTASAGELMQLPGIGPKKAQTIIEYRSGFQGQFAFENTEDLQKIKGIGPKTAEKIGQWFVFKQYPENNKWLNGK